MTVSVRLFVFIVACLAGVSAVAEGVLHVGNVRTREQTATVPITLQGDVASGVASMNFQLNYDPNAVRVVSVDPGRAARDAGKQVQWHEAAPGRVNVVLSGFNQDTIQSGEIAQLRVEPAESGVRNARLHIGSSTFASTTGDVIPSTGSTGALAFRIREDEDSSEEPEEPAPNAPPPPSPGVPGDPGSGPLAPPRMGGGTGDGESVDEDRAAVPEAVERRLIAARQDAEALRPLLGAPRGSAADDESGADSGGGSARSGLDGSGGFETTTVAAPGAGGLDSTRNTTITPEKKLENADDSGHNKGASGVLEGRTQRFTLTQVMVTALVGVFIVLIIYGIRGTR